MRHIEQSLHPEALLSVLGPLASRGDLQHGELHAITPALSKKSYPHPRGELKRFSQKTLQRWYYLWVHHGIEGLSPKPRAHKNHSHLCPTLQERLITLKKDKPQRSIPTLIHVLELNNEVGQGQLSHSSVYRLLKQHDLTGRTPTSTDRIERRSFEATSVGELLQGDVMHGPYLSTPQGRRKTYLASCMDDKSRYLCHSRFYWDESALSIQQALKATLIEHGVPHRLLIDNGAAYRDTQLKTICAHLRIHLCFARPYEACQKGKIERLHRTIRQQFLAECALDSITSLNELNARLWAWVRCHYHLQSHRGLADGMSPMDC